ncbi:putative ATP-binding cassette protein subfamily B, member 2 [Trypanosoma grayi]|uniref:putative ATP-binding cassette protein subfamily B, member 2 n=1 Tax=Trypanosoma grayi TaxID=71804 RepID=UPI0004F41FC8|nr:putative ATP-binding cassette protein subfamily B, member 2 [Trypanosoma grayi]KEG12560.1 putative ATP-binding cassette protein subfamily B, member 2 [Trypanosoma grayi]
MYEIYGFSPINSESDFDDDDDDYDDFSQSEAISVKRASIADMFRSATTLERIIMVIGALAAFGSGVSSPAFMFIFGQMARSAIMGDAHDVTTKFAVMMAILGSVDFVLTSVQNMCWVFSAARQVGNMKIRYFNAVLRQDLSWHDRHKPGELVSRITTDMHAVENGINERLSKGIVSLGTAVFGLVFAIISSWELTLFIMAGFPIAGVIFGVCMLLVSRCNSKCRNQYAKASSISTEVMENIKTTQTFNQEEYELNRFAVTLLASRDSGIKKGFLIGGAVGLMTAIIMVACAGGVVFGSYLIIWGRGDVGSVTSSFMPIMYAAMGLASMFPSLVAFMESRSAAYQLVKTIDRIPRIDIDSHGWPIEVFEDSITFKMVSFRYEGRPSEPIFDQLNFTLQRGQKIAFTGVTGCGKSTILSLIQRFYDPTEGAVLIDGDDLRLLSLYDWRSLIGVVSQEPQLFSGSIIDNVRMGNQEATLDDVIDACTRANIHDTIMQLPDDYYTLVGKGQLSGGQKQRLAIARALVRMPQILLLDEATSALDRKSELEMQEALNTLMEEEGMTVIVIAHRLSTIRYVDCIYHLERTPGKGSYIAEYGTYDELMLQNGFFAAMAMMQSNAQRPLKRAFGMNNSLYLYSNSSEGDINNFGNMSDFADDNDAQISYDTSPELASISNITYSPIEVPFEKRAEWEVDQTTVSFRRVMHLTGRRWAIALGALGSVLNAIALPGSGVVFALMVNVMGEYGLDGDVNKMQKNVMIGAFVFAGLAGLNILASVLQSFYAYAGEYLTYFLRVELFRSILRQDQTFFDMPGHEPGALSGIISGDCEIIHQLWGPTVGAVVRMVVFFFGGIGVSLFFQWKVALVATACMPLVIGCMIIQDKFVSAYVTKNRDVALHTITSESFSAISTIASFNMKDPMVLRYSHALAESQSRTEKLSRFLGITAGLMNFFYYGTVALSFWYGGTLIASSEATFQQVMVSSMAIMVCLMGAGSEVGGLARNYIKASLSARRVFCIIDRIPDIDVYDAGDDDVGYECDVSFKGVQFFYPSRPDTIVLDSTNLCFASGSSNGLMGQTGCGKSTVIQILARFYNPTGGRVLINGKDLREIDIFSWRKNIGIVLQEPSLFSGTVKDNILYSCPDATDEEVEEAASLACIHDEIMNMPDGYDTQVGYRGNELSGGQKQRVAIARSILRRPRLLLLDEATSALDNATEAAVQRNLDELQNLYGTTTVSIAHRLPTIRYCDQIVLLDVGRIIEHGSHDELMASNGEYRARWELTQ